MSRLFYFIGPNLKRLGPYCIFGLLLHLSHALFAEYRVFKLQIDFSNGKSKQIISTLSENEYRMFHDNPNVLKVSRTDSWMCYLDTSFEGYCSKEDAWHLVKVKKSQEKKLSLKN